MLGVISGVSGGFIGEALNLNFKAGQLDPRITYARTSTATVTDFEGLIKPTDVNEARFDGLRRVKNLLTYSQDFSNAAWIGGHASTRIPNSVVAPDGTTTGNFLYENGATDYHIISRGTASIVSPGINVLSCYLKADTRTSAVLQVSEGVNRYAVLFDLLNGVVVISNTTGSPTLISSSIVSVGGGWYRCSIMGVVASSCDCIIATSNSLTPTWVLSVPSYTGDGVSGIYIWGAQLENVTGQSNQNPSEYVSTNAIRRNLLTYSQDFSNAAWTKQDTTVTSGILAPDSTVTAFKITPNVTITSFKQIYQPATGGVGTYTWSIYAKAAGYNFIRVIAQDSTTQNHTWFNLSSGAVGTNTAGNIPSIIAVGNGWYRCSVTRVTGSILGYADFGVADSDGALTMTGDGVSGIYIWGDQLEVGSVATAYQPVTNAAPLDFGNYQGTGADGVQYFPYTNPNAVVGTTLTTIPTTPINSLTSKYAYGCATNGDYFSTPSTTLNNVTGDLSLDVEVALDAWVPAAVQTLVAKDGVSPGTRQFAFNVQTSGVLRLNYSIDGTNIISSSSTVATGYAAGTRHHVTVQRQASTGIIKFYTSEDGINYTQLGTDVAGTAGTLFSTSTAIQFGNLSGLAFALDGKIYDSHIYKGLKYTTNTSAMVADFDPSNWTTGTSWVSIDTGETWTINGNAKIYQGLWNATGSKGLLIEEGRTNIVAYSQLIGGGTWAPNTAGIATQVITTNSGIAPDGTRTATLINYNIHGSVSTVDLTQISAPISLTLGIVYRYSFWARTIDGANSTILLRDNGLTASVAQSFVITPTWNRYEAAGTPVATGIGIFSLWLRGGLGLSDTANFLVWGAQLEVGAFATSYIPTVAASVNRAADSASMTGTNFSSWYNQSEGTMYVEFDSANPVNGLTKAVVSSGGSALHLYLQHTNQLATWNGLTVITGTAVANLASNKGISTYSSTGLQVALNGVTPSVVAGSVGAFGTSSILTIGWDQGSATPYVNGHIKQIKYYSKALPASILQGLTS